MLSPLGSAYHREVQRRLETRQPAEIDCPVVCVGNATMGGVGKTPFVAWLNEELIKTGRSPIILTRGYGGREEGPLVVADTARAEDVGDEPLLLARNAMVVVAKDRAAGARFAAEAGADPILMDDGLQNPSLRKDCSLLLIDGEAWFGNEEVFPAGPLREKPEAAAARCDAIVLIGETSDRTEERVKPLAQGKPVFRARFEMDEADLPSGPVVAFCGIGRPERFERSLCDAGVNLSEFVAFPDHHFLSERDLRSLRRTAEAANAMLVTTQKDFARLRTEDHEGITPVGGTISVAEPAELLRLIEEKL
nr:tetraacyldisaccharide 4'-kinase [Parvularcula maris]